MTTPIQQWLETMKNIWIRQTPEEIASILSTNIIYYESPLEPPLTTNAEVIKAWQEIKSQNIEFIEIDILHETNNIGMAIWKFKEKNKPIHIGCYYIELDNEGKCKHFRQWWNS